MEHSPDLTPLSDLTAFPAPTAAGEHMQTCDRHGAYRNTGVQLRDEILWVGCPSCNAEATDRRRREAEERRLSEWRQQRAKAEEERMLAVIRAARIPLRFSGRGLECFEAASSGQKQALSVARNYAEALIEGRTGGRGLVFSGRPGTGKTHLAAGILQAVLPGRRGRYMTAPDLIRAVRATWRPESPEREDEVLERLTAFDVLVLDEVAVNSGTENEQTILFELIDRRYRALMPTVLVTNQDRAGLHRALGERSFDRLTETARWVTFDWPSRRPGMQGLTPCRGVA